MDSLTGYVEKIIYRNSENGYTVLSVSKDGEDYVCVGCIPFVDEGEYLEMSGEFVFHPSYGEQFKVYHAESVMPTDVIAIERYLGSGAVKGIGEAMAKRIVTKFGADTLRIMDEEPERLAEIKGISMKKAQEIAACQEEKKDLRKAMIFLGNYGISNTLAVKIYDQYREDVYSIIRENPYQLADEISGIGFRRADEIAFHAGVDPGSDYRIRACIIYLLQRASDSGHVYLPEDVLKRALFETLKPVTTEDVCEIEEQDVARCIMDLAVEKRIIVKVPEDGPKQVYYSLYYYTEAEIAKRMDALNLSGKTPETEIDLKIAEVEKDSAIVLDDMQRLAVREAANSGVLIITGGPGTGKTTIINSLIKYFGKDYSNIVLAAPTGRAAKRMEEATGCEAKTIHRLLELSDSLEDSSAGARFNRNEDCPLEADVVIIDEMSMIDMFLMNALVRAIEPGTRLILVGDVDQLPSVGPGNVLRDLIDSGCFKTVKLTKIFRQASESEIIVNAHKINAGEKISLRTDSKDFIFIKREQPAVILAALLTLLRDKLPGYVGAPVRDIQILTPVKKGRLGVQSINAYLQENLNPAAAGKKELLVKDQIFREGDKVMHIKNDYNLEWEMRTESGYAYEKGTAVFNGDIGVIQTINEHMQLVEVRFDDGKYVIYSFEKLEELTLCYASTIHKAQGSEYPAVILPLLTGPPVLMNRNILYTAVTRAKKCVVIVGSDATVEHMIENTREQERYSGLKARLLEVTQAIRGSNWTERKS